MVKVSNVVDILLKISTYSV